MFIHFTNFHQVAICRNTVTGEMWLDSIRGFNFTAPWTKVAVIDIRPVRITIPSSSRNLNSKLIAFNPKFWRTFVDYEGFHYYWWNNRFSFNFGHKEEYRGFDDILVGYSYDVYPPLFIKVLEGTNSQKWAKNL